MLRSAYQRSVAEYWDNEKDPVNLRLGEVDGFYHHHYGVGEYDPAVLDAPAGEIRDKAIIAEMHRLETRPGRPAARLPGRGRAAATGCSTAGSGRGGTSFMANQRFGCQVDGVSISRGPGRVRQ